MDTLAASIAALRAAYPRQDFPDDSVTMYGTMLEDLDASAVSRAIGRLVKRSTWLPSIAEIREEIAEEMLGLPTVSEAVESLARGSHRHPTVDRIFSALGGRWSYDQSTAPGLFRREFTKMYAEERQTAIRAAAGAEPRPALTRVEKMIERHIQGIPETTSMQPRPVYARWLRRNAGTLSPPTDAEKHDAILVLRDNIDVVGEAQRIMDEASA